MLLVLLVAHVLLLLKTQFTLWPEMVVYPYLLNNGFILYKDIINPYTPLFTLALQVFTKIFNYHVLPFQIMTITVILAIDTVIFYSAQKLFGRTSAIISLIFFEIISTLFGINGLWYDLAQTPFIILALYNFLNFLQNPKYKKSLALAVFCLTLAFFIKQQLIWLVSLFFLFSIVQFKGKTLEIFSKNIRIFMFPILLLITFSLYFYSQGALENFYYLAFYFPFVKASQMPGYILLPTARQIVVVASVFLLFIPVLARKDGISVRILLTAAVLVMFAFPRFDYFHLIPSLAVLVVLFGESVSNFLGSKIIYKYLLVFPLLIIITAFIRYAVNHSSNEVRFFERDINKTAEFLKSTMKEKEIIYIQNGPDQLFPMSDTLPTKPWAIQFPWYLEIEKINSAVLSGLKSQSPKFIVSKPYDNGQTYQIGAYRPPDLALYIDSNYENFAQISPTLWLKIKK